LIYGLIDYRLYKGLIRLKQGFSQKKPTFSILICARNEQDSIYDCLKSVLSQDYENSWEVLVADDRSTDRTFEILEDLQKQNPEKLRIFKIESCPQGISPKKNALTELHKYTQYEIIAATDADCLVPSTWLNTLAAEYQDKINMVVGHSYYSPPQKLPKILWGIQTLDFISHHIIAAGSLAQHFPITSSGNNFSYRKNFFNEVQGYQGIDHILSGDDDLLLHKCAAKDPRSIRYCIHPGSFVVSKPVESLRALWEQRKRWASKTIYYSRPAVALLSFVFTWYLGIFLLFLASLSIPELWPYALGTFFCKTLCDYFTTRKGCEVLHHKEMMTWFIPTALFHIPMILGAVIFGIFGSFSWKPSVSNPNEDNRA
jgi:cellulose synthase/poly-beta-1,6-N-acetylglucosamine synthase-like glycosyltransferase